MSGTGGGPSTFTFVPIPSAAIIKGGKGGEAGRLPSLSQPSTQPRRMEPSKQAEIETARLWKVNRTIHELIRDRVSPRLSFPYTGALNARKGFGVAEEEIGMSLEEFKAVYGRGQAVECALFCLWRRFGGH